MENIAKSLANNALAALTSKASGGVIDAIKQASSKTGVNFAYMVQQASAESNFNPTAKAKTSSATGLYQFLDSTWMDMMERHGAKHGIQTEGKSRDELLRMRNNPEVAANMAAEFASDNEKTLNNNWGGEVGATELYFAHFMGAGGASSFLKSRDENPLQVAADLFPKAAAANRNVFYDRDTGRAKTMNEVYSFFDKKFEIANNADIQIAQSDVGSPALGDEADIPALAINDFLERQNNAEVASFAYHRNTGNEFNSDFSRSYAPSPYQSLIGNPIEVMMLSQLDLPMGQVDLAGDEKKNTALF